MPPVELDSIPRFASSGVKVAKDSITSANDDLELGSFKPVLTRSKGVSPKDDGTIKDVEVPEVDSEDETTIDKLLKDYSEDESEDSDYVPSEDSEEDQDSTENDFVNTRSKGFLPEDSGFVQDVDIPEIDSEDETTIVKLMKDYSDADEVEADSDYIPYEDSEEDLEYDSNASISDDECETEQIEDVDMPTFDKKISNVVINDVNIPPVSNVVIKDVPFGQTDDDAWSQFSTIATNVMELVADNPIVQAGIKTLDYGLELSEKIFAPIFTPYKEHVQNARRHLRAIRRSGSSTPSDGFLATLIQLFKVNWFLNLIGVSVTVDASVGRGRQGFNYGIEEQEDSEDEESTVYKLMKEYDSQDDEDYVPVYCSEDSMEFDSDSSDDETIVEKIMKDYSEGEDFDYVPSDEDSEDELEYDSDAEISDDSDYDSSDVDDCSEDETLLEKLLKDYSEDESDFDGDYIPGEEVDGDIEYDSEASITECSEEDSEDVSESDESDDAESEETCSEVEEHEIAEEDSQEMDEESQETEDEESQGTEDEESQEAEDEESQDPLDDEE